LYSCMMFEQEDRVSSAGSGKTESYTILGI
jgi:hypothetical protein